MMKAKMLESITLLMLLSISKACQLDIWVFDSLTHCTQPNATGKIIADGECRSVGLFSSYAFPGYYRATCDGDGLVFLASGCSDSSCQHCEPDGSVSETLYQFSHKPLEIQPPLGEIVPTIGRHHKCFSFSSIEGETIYYAFYGSCTQCPLPSPSSPASTISSSPVPAPVTQAPTNSIPLRSATPNAPVSNPSLTSTGSRLSPASPCELDIWVFDSLSHCTEPNDTGKIIADGECRSVGLFSSYAFPGYYRATCDGDGLVFLASGCSDSSCQHCEPDESVAATLYQISAEPLEVQPPRDDIVSSNGRNGNCSSFSSIEGETIYFAFYGACSQCPIPPPPTLPPVVTSSSPSPPPTGGRDAQAGQATQVSMTLSNVGPLDQDALAAWEQVTSDHISKWAGPASIRNALVVGKDESTIQGVAVAGNGSDPSELWDEAFDTEEEQRAYVASLQASHPSFAELSAITVKKKFGGGGIKMIKYLALTAAVVVSLCFICCILVLVRRNRLPHSTQSQEENLDGGKDVLLPSDCPPSDGMSTLGHKNIPEGGGVNHSIWDDRTVSVSTMSK